MDASTPPAPPAATALRWLPWVNLGVALLCLLWMIPTWFIAQDMFVDLPVEVRPPASAVYLLVAVPLLAGVALSVAGLCLARRRGYFLALLASAATVFTGPPLILGIINIVMLAQPAARAQFKRTA
jgi:hypothetical protein